MKKMTQTFINKNIKLLLEFDRYVMTHARALSAIPNGATLVMAVAGDEKFNKESRAMVIGAGSKRRKLVEARKAGNRWTVRPLAQASK